MHITSLDIEYKRIYLLNCLEGMNFKDNESSEINPKRNPHRQNSSKVELKIRRNKS